MSACDEEQQPSTTTRTLQRSPTAAEAVRDVLIVGGGLSGLVVADGLQRLQQRQPHQNNRKKSWTLLEARNVLGGRLANAADGSVDDGDGGSSGIDMGGAWIWPSHQPRAKELVVRDLKLETFRQPDDPSSTRIVGGAVRIVRALVDRLKDDGDDEEPIPRSVHLNTAVTKCELIRQSSNDEGVVVKVTAVSVSAEPVSTTTTFLARKVVFAVPPKLLHKHVEFDPPLSPEKWKAMDRSRTWMAGVTKVALVYPRRFWNANDDRWYSNMGLPGGPAFQVYDSGTADGAVSALTFFALDKYKKQGGASTVVDKEDGDDDARLAKQVADQMSSTWLHMGQPDLAVHAHGYARYHVKRWPLERYISEDPEPATVHPHPYPVPALSTAEWDGALLFAGSETDRASPGVMEGAIAAAQRVLESLMGR